MRFRASLAVAMAVLVLACGDNTSPAGPVDLTGSYVLQSATVGGSTVPNSSGTLVLTGATYDISLVLNGQVQPEDVGTYLVSGVDGWSQHSTSSGSSASGTFSVAGTTLTISYSFPSSRILVWNRTTQP
jgi:hypothetical protein